MKLVALKVASQYHNGDNRLCKKLHSNTIKVRITMALALSPIPCSLCFNGEVITLPEKEISIQGFEFVNDCQTLADFAPLLFQQESDECNLLQSIGTICGCPKPEEACDLCADGSKVEYGWRELAFLADTFGGVVPTCELVEAGLHSYNNDDSYCAGSQLILSEYCGCGAELGSQPDTGEEEVCSLCSYQKNVPFPNKTIDIIGFPFQTCGQLDEAAKTLFSVKNVEDASGLVDNNCFLMRQLSVHCGCASIHRDPCPICKLDESYEVPHPEKRLDSSLTHIFMGDMELSCGVLADIARTWSATTPDHTAVCLALQGLGTECGCTRPMEPACEICPNALPEESFGLILSDVPPYDRITCGITSSVLLFVEDGDQIPLGLNGGLVDFRCQNYKYLGFACGCNDGMFTYWGAGTAQKQRAAVWAQRTTAILSLGGSVAILVDIFTTKQRANQGMYYQIMIGLSIFDILSSIAWGLGPLPTNPNLARAAGVDQSLAVDGVLDTLFYGSHGNDASCTAQGFLLHLGFTSMLYNVALSYFFKLSVVDGWRDAHFTARYRALILVVPAAVGTIVAFAAIPFITFTPVACTIGSYKGYGGWAKVIGLFYLPYGLAFIYTPLNTYYIYWKVRAQGRRGDRWRLSGAGPESTRSGFEDCGTGGDSSEGTRIRRLSKILDRVKLRRGSESQMEKLVFWQSCWYVVAFFSSYSVFLVAFALDGWEVESYWFYILVSILTPMQGFFNGCVYFRKRIIRWFACGKKCIRESRRKPMRLLLNGLLRPVTAISDLIRRRRASAAANVPFMHNNTELNVRNVPVGSSANLSQPVELLNDRRANTTGSEGSEQEEKAEELSLHDSSRSSVSLLPSYTTNEANEDGRASISRGASVDQQEQQVQWPP